MDLQRLIRTLFEHWIVVALTLVVTVLAVVLLASRAEDEYETSVTMFMLEPSFIDNGGEIVNRNPLLGDGRAAGTTAGALISIVDSITFASDADEAGVVSDWELSFNASGAGSLLDLVTVGPDPTTTVSDLQTIFDMTVIELDLLQERAGVAVDKRVNLRVIDEPTPPDPLFASKARTVLATGALGVIAAVNFAFLAAALHRRRDDDRRTQLSADDIDRFGPDDGDIDPYDESSPDADEVRSSRWGRSMRGQVEEPV